MQADCLHEVAGALRMTGAPFHLAEIDLARPALAAPATDPGIATRPRLALARYASRAAATETLRVSDLGYRTPVGDPAGLLVYPPRLEQAFAVDRTLALAPDQPGVAYAVGSIRILNADRALDHLAAGSLDARAFRILAGTKGWDAARAIETDPAMASLETLFAGIPFPPRLAEGVVEIPLRDAGYWLERPLQQDVYLGTGGLDGTADMAGRPKPKLRGGSVANPVRFIAPVLVDPTRRIYQYSDAQAQIVTLYEGGLAGNIAHAGDVADLTAGSVAGGFYRTDNARGLFQLGAEPARPILLDAVGRFPSGTLASTAAEIIRRILLEDCQLAAGLVDTAAFTALDAACPWTAGCYWDGQDAVDAASALSDLLRGLGAKLVPTRAGTLRPLALRAPAAGEAVAASYGTETIVEAVPVPLPDGLSPPPIRAIIGHGRTWTVQVADLAPTVVSATRQRLAAQWQYAAQAAPAETLATYIRPNAGTLVETALLDAADAAALAAAQAALWCVPRALHAVTLPVEVARRHDLGALLRVTFPVAGLSGGATGRIVGEQLRDRDAGATLLLLV